MLLRGQDICEIQINGMCNLYVGIFGTYGAMCTTSLVVFYLRVQWTVWGMSRSVRPSATTEYSGQQSTNAESTMKAFFDHLDGGANHGDFPVARLRYCII